MAKSMNEILHPGQHPDNDFPNAPEGWDRGNAMQAAAEEGLRMEADHWELVNALHEYFSKHKTIHMRELHDALDEKFHRHGGMRHLYRLFPGGPVAQGCRIAGLEPPAGSIDLSYGSVQ